MKGLDIIVVLKSGLDEENYYSRKYESFSEKGINTRLLFYIPLKFPDDLRESINCWDYNLYSFFSSKEHHCWQSEERRAFFIYPNKISFEEYISNPQVRLSDDANPNNAVLIVDDYMMSGDTMNRVMEDLKKLGYVDKNIFGYVGHGKSGLFDFEGRNILLSDIYKEILNSGNQNN